ncbi:MAG: hypothetical protein HOW73_11575 [Polyangiaceae bacterium]|nr:hypothetical protein [Polyangiaceae bacterium]
MTNCPIVIPVDAKLMRIEEDARTFYTSVLRRLHAERVPFLLGGAFALSHYSGVARDTKDLDLFIRPCDWDRVAKQLGRAGYEIELTFSHWLGKARSGPHFIDLIFNSGNGLTPIDEEWFFYAQEASVLGMQVKLVPPEECIWSKCFVMERERFDGADVAHLLRSCAATLDWRRLIDRFGDKWRILAAHVILFEFIYPGERDKIPAWVWQELLGRLTSEMDIPPSPDQRCQGTLVSRAQYLVDIERWGYKDARLVEEGGGMTPSQIDVWTKAINKVG